MKLLRPFIAMFISSMLFSTSVAKGWDHFVYVQTWPPAECVEAEHQETEMLRNIDTNVKKNTYVLLAVRARSVHRRMVVMLQIKCHLGREVSTWTIHGLWPTLGTTHTPDYCNNSYKFNFDQIADLKESLLKYWPDLFHGSDSFWSHEWDKHGTCCMDLSSTAGEHNYFATSLSLNRKFDLLKFLREGNVTPNDTAEYKVSDFINAIKKATGVKPILICSVRKEYDVFGRKTNSTLIGQVRICLKKDLTPMECPDEAEYSANKQTPTSLIDSKLDIYDNLGFGSCPLKFRYPPIQHK